ncbi:unnamed protein product [Clonostachys solani]|uniref:Protein kinase domain-containing protein n=1 Tax=Clonostachys solani TaxID=160281 RepID=A0A9N9W4Q9_9HYPO|nr:unnamed protein product [Clonostachys solani]
MAAEILAEKIEDGELEIKNKTDDKKYVWIPFDHIENLVQDEANIRAVLEKQPKGTSSVDDMTSFVLGRAKRLFAMLVRYDKLHWLKLFYENKFADDQFPIERISLEDQSRDDVTSNCKWAIRSINHPENEVPFPAKAKKDDIDYLCDQYQWRFFVPVFIEDDGPVYSFNPSLRFPFLKEIDTGVESNFSVVRHYVIHRRHIKLEDNRIAWAKDNDGNPHVAVKKLILTWSETAGKSKKIALNESDVLHRFKQRKHRHLIRVIACYRQGSDYFFMFPWAVGGDLRNFWNNYDILAEESLNFSSTDWELYIEWFLRQLKGLAEAIKTLHYSEDKPGENCRHGDLKPENILCFGNRLPARGEMPTDFTLVITDAGLAKVHEKETQARIEPTTTQGGTQRYAAPEVVIDKKHARSRLYDIWSLGVLYLEFLIWILFGKDGLKNFHEATAEDYCFDTNPDPQVKPIVTEWIQAVKGHPICSSSGHTALSRLISLIEDRLLVVAYSNIQGQSPDAEVESQRAKSSNNESFQIVVTRPTFPLSDNKPIRDDKPIRADAEDTLKELEKIYHAAMDQKSLPWINWDGMAQTAKQGPKTVSNLEPRLRRPSVSKYDATPRGIDQNSTV